MRIPNGPAPTGEAATDGIEDPAKRADECALTVRRGTMAFLLVCFACLAVLGKPSGDALAKNEVTLPFLNVPVTPQQFLLFAPFTVIAVWLYMQIFIRELRRLEREGQSPSVAVLGFMPGFVPAFLSWSIQYGLMPVILVFILERSRVHAPSPLFYVIAIAGFAMAGLAAVLNHWDVGAIATKLLVAVKKIWDSKRPKGSAAPQSKFALPGYPVGLRIVRIPSALVMLVSISVGGIGIYALIDKKQFQNIVIAEGKNFEGRNLVNRDFSGANLRAANLQAANLRGADLMGANLREANLREANLREANLREANLQGANLREANLEGANLVRANLRRANLREANLEGANLRVANLQGAKLLASLRLTRIQVCQAKFDKRTVFPNGSRGHTRKDVCAAGVPNDAFGLTLPETLPKRKKK